MAFAARTENGKHRLCLRKGQTFHGTSLAGEWEEFEFSSQARAKACAGELNRLYWKAFEKTMKKKQMPPFAWEMYELVKEYAK